MALPTRLTAHPATVDETYGEHCRFAFGIAGKLFGAAAAAAVHAIYPPAFEKTASNRIKELNTLVTTGARGALGMTDTTVEPQHTRLLEPSAA